jgi:hypothetical protein
LRDPRNSAILVGVSPGLLLFAIVCMIVLEMQHLRWIWWEYWDCRSCGVKNKHCGCEKFRWQLWV